MRCRSVDEDSKRTHSYVTLLSVRYRKVIPLASIVASLTACSHSGSPNERTSSSAPSTNSSSPLASSTPSRMTPPSAVKRSTPPGLRAPTRSALARTHSPAGAAAFAGYWFQTLDWAYETTDSTLARGSFRDGCAECERFAEIFDDAMSRHEHFVGGRIAVTSWAIVPGGSDPNVAVDVTFNQTAVKEVTSDGSVAAQSSRHSGTVYRVWTRWTHGGWTVTDLKQVVDR